MPAARTLGRHPEVDSSGQRARRCFYVDLTGGGTAMVRKRPGRSRSSSRLGAKISYGEISNTEPKVALPSPNVVPNPRKLYTAFPAFGNGLL